MPNSDQKMILLTGLWKSTSKSGAIMLSGNLSHSSRIVILQNKASGQQTNESDRKKPDYLAFLAPNNPMPPGTKNSKSGPEI